VSGTASEGALITGRVVKLKDAYGNPAVETITNTTGGFSIDVANLTAPFLVTVTGTNGTYISLAQTAGTANINPITTMVVALAAGTPDVSALFTGLTPAQLTTINTNYTVKSALVTTSLQAALPSGFTAGSYFTGTVTAGTGMDAMFDTYQIVVHPTNGITVKTNDASATTCLTIPVATVTANTTGPLPTINVPTPTPTPTPIPTPTPTPTPIPTPTPPTTPTGFAVTTASASQINLFWNASTGATGYKIYKSGSYLKTVTATSTSDTGLTSSTNYCYYVIANNSAGDSVQTSQLCTTTFQAQGSAGISGYWQFFSTTPGQTEQGVDYVLFSQSNNAVTSTAQCGSTWAPTGTVSGNTITLNWIDGGNPVSLTGTINGDSMSGSWSDPRESGTWRAVKLTSPTCDTTRDTTRPTVIATNPVNGATEVSRSVNQISVTFSKQMSANEYRSGSSYWPTSGATPHSWDPTMTIYTIGRDSVGLLPANTVISITLGDPANPTVGFKDTANNYLNPNPFTISFTTGAN
jgi:hypothetical protein